MPIKQLLPLIAPPLAPLDNEGVWRASELVVGAKYPADFRALIEQYGSGAFFQGYLTVYNPLTIGGLAWIKDVERVFRPKRERLYPLPLPVHPDTPGLLFWGGDDNGNHYAWLTKGKPDKWPVVFLGHGSESHPIELRTDITGFLAGYAMDQFEQLVQPGNPVTEEMRVFTPGRNQGEVARALFQARKGR
ncbi:MAG TPA: SMI1/KNR4 family protein [Urbifossiella sp.]|nr:SMI1/KNR4 family protein [Urbifossiella sp.]